jgi:putative ATP-dependent endonuclease of the OLD family
VKLTQLRISSFQSFGETPIAIDLQPMTYLLGPNGAGKTAVLQALARMFSYDLGLRKVRKTDFHVPTKKSADDPEPTTFSLWIEALFEFPELADSKGKYSTIPGHFAHMKLEAADSVPRIRIRLSAQMDEDGEIEETLNYVVQVDELDEPKKVVIVPKHDRNSIQVHYLPARRDPSDHISFSANALLGRALRAANWQTEREEIKKLTSGISEALSGNESVKGIGSQIGIHWSEMHTGDFYTDPHVSFERNEIESLLRHLTVGFSPGHEAPTVNFSRLSDGQQSLLYLSIVLSVQSIGRKVLAKAVKGFDVDKLRPAVFTMIAMEEPENSLSPHYLGRVIKALTSFSAEFDAQSVVATHSPSLLRRVPPESIRYLRLNVARTTTVTIIVMPDEKEEEAHKFVREAVQAFPELYFSRLVVLGEGDSEEIVLPRLLQARGLAADETSISVVPLGGRHVNHFWRLLHGLGIPFVTLLDLDLGRFGGGWGRVKYAIAQLLRFPTIQSNLTKDHLTGIPSWDTSDRLLESENGKGWLKFLESAGVFFSSPLDLDFALLSKLGEAYGVDDDDLELPDDDTVTAVLGKSHDDVNQYAEDQQQLFTTYHKIFKLGSKPAAHISAMAGLDDFDLDLAMPESIGRLLDLAKKKVSELPE